MPLKSLVLLDFPLSNAKNKGLDICVKVLFPGISEVKGGMVPPIETQDYL